jgi:hypothetical protein
VPYSVNHWFDALKKVKEKKAPTGAIYFDTEQEAKNYIIERASAAVVDARAKLMEAEKRLRKCKSKYGPHDGQFVSPLLQPLSKRDAAGERS